MLHWESIFSHAEYRTYIFMGSLVRAKVTGMRLALETAGLPPTDKTNSKLQNAI